MTAKTKDYVELDCPWFDSEWLCVRPEFPLAASLTEDDDTTITNKKEIAA